MFSKYEIIAIVCMLLIVIIIGGSMFYYCSTGNKPYSVLLLSAVPLWFVMFFSLRKQDSL